MPFKFEKLEVWKLAIELSNRVNAMCKRFPKEELFILTSQMKRAADAVSLNIAEGSTGQSNQKFQRFLGYDLRSAIEVVSCIYLAKNRDYISENDFKQLYDFIDSLCKKIQALRNSLK